MNERLIGLDLETSGLDPQKHVVLQVGLALDETDIFRSDVGWGHQEWEEAEKEALAVNGFTYARVLDGPRAYQVDQAMVAWLAQRSYVAPRSLCPVGWNVAGFDMPFFALAFPATNRLMHYRTVELTAICVALELAGGADAWDIKRAAQAHAAKEVVGKIHEAGFDAAAGIAALHYLVNEINR